MCYFKKLSFFSFCFVWLFITLAYANPMREEGDETCSLLPKQSTIDFTVLQQEINAHLKKVKTQNGKKHNFQMDLLCPSDLEDEQSSFIKALDESLFKKTP